MTEREEAQAKAEDALRRASTLKDRGDKIATAWRQSRVDNNFRMMLRKLAERGTDGAT